MAPIIEQAHIGHLPHNRVVGIPNPDNSSSVDILRRL
jgi:GTP cyclohydrolase I